MFRPCHILLAWLCLAAGTTGQTSETTGPPALPYAPRHVLVKFNPVPDKNLLPQSRARALESLLARLALPEGARLEEPPLSQWLRKHNSGKQRPGETPSVDLKRFLYLHLPPGLTVTDCVARLERHPWIEYVEPDGLGTGGLIVPNDPDFSLQWHHQNLTKIGADIHTPAAWTITAGSSNVVVAVIDTGLNLNLPEFSGRLVPGYDFANGDADPSDDHGHGTGVAGTLGAIGNNGTLVAGVDWRCRLMPIKALDARNSGWFSWWAQAVDFAVTNGAKIINLSAGGSGSSLSLTRAITNAIAQGAIFVTITHNNGTNRILYPGNLPASITVGATDELDRRANFSNFGPEIDLVAPGKGIYTVSQTGSLTRWDGTSFAAPLVSGVCALLASLCPNLTQEQALAFLTAGADDQVGDATDTPGFDIYYGYGRLNAYNSILLANPNTADVALTQASDPNPVSVSCELTLTLTVTNRGPDRATGTVVTNFLPPDTLLLSAVASQGSVTQHNQMLEFQLGSLGAGSSAVLRLDVWALAPGILTNQAVVAAHEQDVEPSNNQSTLTVPAILDQTGPKLLSAAARSDGRTIELTFSEALSEATANDPAHYSLRDGLTNALPLDSIRPGERKNQILLEAPLLSFYAPFTLTVDGLQDCLGQPMPAPSQTVILADSDGDHMPDQWESENGLNPNDPADGGSDNDGDRLSNQEEYVAGTNPNDPQSSLRVDQIESSRGSVEITFLAVSNRTYSLLYRHNLLNGTWEKLADFPHRTTNWTVTVSDPAPATPQRYYQLVTPKQP